MQKKFFSLLQNLLFTSSSILTLLGSGHQKPAWSVPVPNVQ